MCLANSDCGEGQVCYGNRCEVGVACTSAKQCEGRVCATDLGVCSDCNSSADCSDGKQCVGNSCVPLPKSCASDADCTRHGLVCEPSTKVCFECAGDNDCIDPAKPVCGIDHICEPRTCEPKAVECVDEATIRICNDRGAAWNAQPCGNGTICQGTACVAQICAPGTTRCDGVNVMTCDATGLAESATDCGVVGKICRAGSCAEITCGDGIKSGSEECDDGNASNTDGCTNACKLPVCGDGFVGPWEQCDDGNISNTDSCVTGCVLARCGDAYVGPGEACDDGNSNANDGCTNSCRLPACGDGVIQSGEVCDDGNTSNTDGCTNACQLPRCGDGFVQSGEQCDGGATCRADCTSIGPNWATVFSADFSTGTMEGLTLCGGCSGWGCPHVESGALRLPADWNVFCAPMSLPASSAQDVKFEYDILELGRADAGFAFGAGLSARWGVSTTGYGCELGSQQTVSANIVLTTGHYVVQRVGGVFSITLPSGAVVGGQSCPFAMSSARIDVSAPNSSSRVNRLIDNVVIKVSR